MSGKQKNRIFNSKKNLKIVLSSNGPYAITWKCQMDTFLLRDLPERIGELIHNAEAGKLSLVIKHGQPVF